MKKLLFMICVLLVLPFNVKALAYSESFNVGDRVAVLIENDTSNKEFFVLRPSASGDTYVDLFFNGNVTDENGHAITVYDETLPGTYTPSGILEQAIDHVYRVLTKGTESWTRIAEGTSPRLLNLEDLGKLGITKNADGKYPVMANNHFLAQIITRQGIDYLQNPESGYNYWTEISEKDADGNVYVYVVTYNPSFNGDTLVPVAYIEPVLISGDVLSDPTYVNPEFIVRPVVRVDKKYIDCFLNTTAPVSSPPTSENLVPVELFGVLAFAAVIYMVIKKKEVFSKI